MRRAISLVVHEFDLTFTCAYINALLLCNNKLFLGSAIFMYLLLSVLSSSPVNFFFPDAVATSSPVYSDTLEP